MNKKLVLKFGTNSLLKNENLSDDIFNTIANQVAILKKKGVGVAIVSSGAIQAGKEATKNMNIALNKKEIAGIGSRHLLNMWAKAFSFYGLEVCEMLVTHANWCNKNEQENIKTGILDCFNNPIIPIINENDIVSDEEIRWMEDGISENDKLARMVAMCISADGILFITKSDGVYDQDPAQKSAKKIPVINGFCVPRIVGKSQTGSGGIETKIREGILCANSGIKKVSIAMLTDDVIIKFNHGQRVGTEITK